MPAELHDAIENADYLLGVSLPPFTSGALASIEHTGGVATLYRSRGIARMLTKGVVEPLFVAQIQSAATHLFGLGRLAPAEQMTSKAASFWDAIGSQCWDAAQQIAQRSHMSHDPKREHEDDFLYVAFIMQRYFLAPAEDAPPAEREAFDAAQDGRLERWEEVLEGNHDPRLDLCHALVQGDAEAFEEALVAVGDERDANLQKRHARESLSAEQMAWLQPVWPKGLALLRLAARDGLALPPGLVVPRVPPLMLADNPYEFHPDAWRSPEFHPTRRA